MRHNRKKCVAKIDRNGRRELLYLLFFYTCKIKYVKSAEKIELKKIDLREENRDINAVLVDMYFKIVQEIREVPWYGKILVNENKVINSYLLNIS